MKRAFEEHQMNGFACLPFAALFVIAALPVRAQSPANPAMDEPDRVAWQLFAVVNAPATSAGNNNATFETWASDEDTFTENPTWPSTPSPTRLKVPALVRLAPLSQRPRVLPGGSEEVRRNKDAFDFIVSKMLHTQSGLKAAFASGKPISFPEPAIEIKANWVPLNEVSDISLYHTNTASDGKTYALVSMHIISKLVPNWTWATFEHRLNKGRCDYMGCRDNFGAIRQLEPAKTPLGGTYPACEKTPAAKQVFASAKLAAVWENHCLKGSQVDFVTTTGVPTLLGNSVTEDGFVGSSSCLTCHSRASVTSTGEDAQEAGFVGNASPNGAPNPTWFWNNPGKPDQSLKAFQTDFVWAIPLLAIPQ
jgi:hypothetical protein